SIKLFFGTLFLGLFVWSCKTHEEKKVDTRTCYTDKPSVTDSTLAQKKKDSIRKADSVNNNNQKNVPLRPCYVMPPPKKPEK
ncbi:MAG: hypothetical protein V2A54_15185, partial [Bacteroidota bacterium]